MQSARPVRSLFHIGDIAMLRRLAGSRVRGKNYFEADISGGRVGPDQAPSKVDFG